LVITKGIGFKEFAQLSLYSMPILIFTVMPIATLIAFFIELKRFYSEKELIALHASGVSNFQISKPFIGSAVVMALICYIFSFYLLPKSYTEFKKKLFFLRSNYAYILIEEGVFSNKISGLTIYISKKYNNNEFEGIIAHDSRQHDKDVTITAKYGKIEVDEERIKFLVKNGERQEYNYQTGHVTIMKFDHYLFDFNILKMINSLYSSGPIEQYIWDLLRFQSKDLDKQALYHTHGHHRILWPLYCISLTLILLCLILKLPNHREVSKRSRAMLILIPSTIILLSIFFENTALKNQHLIFLMYLNAFAPFIMMVRILK
jgi:lipopolysaccharide export system permease protein